MRHSTFDLGKHLDRRRLFCSFRLQSFISSSISAFAFHFGKCTGTGIAEIKWAGVLHHLLPWFGFPPLCLLVDLYYLELGSFFFSSLLFVFWTGPTDLRFDTILYRSLPFIIGSGLVIGWGMEIVNTSQNAIHYSKKTTLESIEQRAQATQPEMSAMSTLAKKCGEDGEESG